MTDLPRPLTNEEETLVQWLLENGNAEAKIYKDQIGRLEVTSRCPCGCASVDFYQGDPSKRGGMKVISDFLWDNNGSQAGVFLYVVDEKLGGIEVVSYDEGDAPQRLPDVSVLNPWEKGPN